MAKLSMAQRKKLPRTSFALPGKGAGPHGKGAGSYPIPDESHARNALARVSQHGTAEEKARVRGAVRRKFPGIGKERGDEGVGRYQRGGEVEFKTPQDLAREYALRQGFWELNRQLAMNERPTMFGSGVLTAPNYGVPVQAMGPDVNLNPAQARHTPARQNQARGDEDVEELGRGASGVRKMPKMVGRPPRGRPIGIAVQRVAVAKGFGPRHAENAREGEEVSTDTVPAMLTPREAVLNRNAAEMAGRGAIERLNEVGNELADEGVDLAGGEQKMKAKGKGKVPGYQGGGYAGAMPDYWPTALGWSGGRRGARPGWSGGGLGWSGGNPGWTGGGGLGFTGGSPGWSGGGGWNPYPLGAISQIEPMRRGGWNPYPLGAISQIEPGGLPQLPSRSFYPGQRRGGAGFYQYGTSGVEPIGTPPSGEAVYGPPVQLSAPEILQYLQKEAKKQGLSKQQISGLSDALGSVMAMGSGATGGYYGEGSTTSQALGPAMEAAFAGGYQGGTPDVAQEGAVSELGYPPFVAPEAVFHQDKGGWIGRYDPLYSVPVYQRGSRDVGGGGEMVHPGIRYNWDSDRWENVGGFDPEIWRQYRMLGDPTARGGPTTLPGPMWPGPFFPGNPFITPGGNITTIGSSGYPRAIPVEIGPDYGLLSGSRHMGVRKVE